MSPETATTAESAPDFANTTALEAASILAVDQLIKNIDAQLKESIKRHTRSLLEVLGRLTTLFSKDLKTWSSERYLEKRKTGEFITDLISYLDEYAALMPVVTYQYGPNGMQNGYTESMSVIAQNHWKKLETDGMSTARAEMEYHVALNIEDWMNDASVQVGEQLIGVSPRGTKIEGYPGLNLKNYVFINIFEKLEDGFLLRQYRSYDPNEALPEFQQQLLTQFGGSLDLATDQALPRADLTTINNMIALPAGSDLAQLESLIYQNKANWKVDIDKELPKLDGEAYFAEVSKLTTLCVQTLETMISKAETAPEDAKKLDLLISTIKDALVKWVETHASNYEQTEEPYLVDENELEEVWLAEVAKEEGKALSSEQQSLLNKFKNITKLNPNLPLRGMMSWGHCLAGSPFSMSAQVLKMNGLKMNAIGMNAGGLENALSALNMQEKDQLAEELAQLTRISVNGEVWYVPFDYLEEPGCYWDEAQGCVVGPCGIPLSQDSLARTEDEYQALMQYLIKQDFANDPDLAVDQKISAIHLYDLLEGKICKQSIGIDGWINNNIVVSNTDALGEKLRQLHQEMETSANPLLYLYTTVRELVINNDKDEIDVYIKECDQSASPDEEVTIFDGQVDQENSGKAFLLPTQANSFPQVA